jgi:exonuclease III
MGDMNICVGEEDALNRKQSQNEKILVKNLVENNKMLKLKDCYRHLQKKMVTPGIGVPVFQG